jgi:hypothetical protein
MSNYIELMEQVFLNEMPRHTGSSEGLNHYEDLKFTKKANEDAGNYGKKLPNNLWMIYCDANNVLVWVEENKVIQIIAALKLFNNMPSINTIGKLKGSAIYASDFYLKIIEVFGQLLLSGHLVSDDAITMWKNMVRRGLNVFIYDPTQIRKYVKITDPDDLDTYIGSSDNYENYRFVLSKNNTIAESIVHIFEMYFIQKMLP